MTTTVADATLNGMKRLIGLGAGVIMGMPLAMLGGCVNVTAPDKPIQINLNVTITQDVVLRLDNDAKALIKDNPGIF